MWGGALSKAKKGALRQSTIKERLSVVWSGGTPDTYRSVYKHNKSSFFPRVARRVHLRVAQLDCVFNPSPCFASLFPIHLSATSGKARASDLLRTLSIDFPRRLMKSLFIRVLAQKQQTTTTSSSAPSFVCRTLKTFSLLWVERRPWTFFEVCSFLFFHCDPEFNSQRAFI